MQLVAIKQRLHILVDMESINYIQYTTQEEVSDCQQSTASWRSFQNHFHVERWKENILLKCVVCAASLVVLFFLFRFAFFFFFFEWEPATLFLVEFETPFYDKPVTRRRRELMRRRFHLRDNESEKLI